MPDRDVQTIKDLIFYQYAKIIARRAFSMPDGKSAKSGHYGFIKKTFLELKSGAKSWSEISREDWQFVEFEKKCIYCGALERLHKEHIVPKSLNIKEECKSCDTIQEIHNQVWACEDCNLLKKAMGLYEFFKMSYPNEKKYYDFIPPLLEKKYLKTIYKCHECKGTLNCSDINKDGKIDVIDIDFIIHNQMIK